MTHQVSFKIAGEADRETLRENRVRLGRDGVLTGFACNEESVSSRCPFNPLSPKSDQHQISPCNIIVCKREWS